MSSSYCAFRSTGAHAAWHGSSASQSAEQLTFIAARLSTVRCRELLAATCVELLKAALVGSADSAPSAPAVAEEAGGAACSASGGSQTPEDLLDSLHATLSATLQDAAHQIAPEHHEAWAEGQWEAFQEAHNAVQRMLLGLHSQAAQGGCAGGALQVARCLEHGLLVPQDSGAAFREYKIASALGSGEGSLRCGIHFFEGTAPAGRDGAKAFDFLSQALEAAEANLSSSDGSSQQLPDLAAPPPDTAVEGDVPPLLSAAEVRYSALTWIGRCYMEGAGVERSIVMAANCFRQAGNAAELGHLAALKSMYAAVADADLAVDAELAG